MDRPRNASPPLAARRAPHHRPAPSPAPHSAAYDGDEDRPSPMAEKPSGPGMDGHDGNDGERLSHKKPRHRHSPTQLAALNALFDRGEHPSLDERTELAERLGMQTKTVSAWFQNKRASTKKRNKPAPANPPSIANLLNPPHPAQHSPQPRTHAPSPRKSRQKDLHLNDHILADPLPTVSHTQDTAHETALESSFFAGPSEFFGQERFVLSHHRGRDSDEGAVPQLRNPGPDRLLPDTDSRFVSENDVHPPRRARNDVARTRTSPEQAEELRRAYARNDHPTRDQRQQLADKIGMHLKSVTNWFQNQRSQAKKQRELSSFAPPVSARPPTGSRDGSSTSRMPHPPLPPRSHHPSLMIPDHDPCPALPKLLSASIDDYRELSSSQSRTSLPPSLSSRMSSPRTRTSVAPYTRDSKDLHNDEGRHCENSSESTKADDPLARPRRSRPEPHQLDALKKLLHRTLTPSMEERNALALEVGMDVGKVTNWFRNIRQNARKRGKRSRASAASTNPHEYDVSSASSVYDDDDAMDLIHENLVDQDMDDRSDEDYQEAVTPFTDVSSSPPPNKRSRPHLPADDATEPMDVDLVKPSGFQEFKKVVGMAPIGGPSDDDLGMNAVTYSGVKFEDALLLLSFHQHAVH